MRVLFSSVGGVGHVFPMIPLAKALMARGHEVRWATAVEAWPQLADAGIATERAGLALGAAMGEYRRRYPEAARLPPAEAPEHMSPRLFGEIAAAAMLDELLALARPFGPDLLVHDAGEFAAPIVAALLGVPAVTHAFGALLPAQRVAGAGERAAPLWQAHGLEPRPFGGSYDTLYLDIYPPSLQAATVRAIPRQLLRSVTMARPGETPFAAGADASRPLVYLTFGTVFRDQHLLRRAIDAIAGLEVRLLVTVGPATDPDVVGWVPSNVRVERFVPQSQVLPGCAIVVSHAGSGTFLAALAHGIPQLCLPQGADQFLNAAAGARYGAGIALEPAEATRTAIREAVDRLLAEDGFRRRAEVLAGEIAAMPGPDEVAGILEGVGDRSRHA